MYAIHPFGGVEPPRLEMPRRSPIPYAMSDALPDGTVHALPDDLRAVLTLDAAAGALWQGLTPLGRNEFICWVEDAKQPATRARRIVRTLEEMAEGKRRPCCWAGCVHRSDKAPGRWQRAVMVGRVEPT
jgi:Bacteriocin-protection, YdeI or OmpD-Associated